MRSRPTLHARGNRCDHGRSHLELILAVLDSVPPGDPVEVGVGRPDFAFFVLEYEQSHRPVEPGIGIRGDELRKPRALALDRKKLAAFSALGGGFLRFPIGDRRGNRTRASVGNAGGNARPSLTNATLAASPLLHRRPPTLGPPARLGL